MQSKTVMRERCHADMLESPSYQPAFWGILLPGPSPQYLSVCLFLCFSEKVLASTTKAFVPCSEIMEVFFIALFYESIKFHDIYGSLCHEAGGLLAFILFY